MHVEFRGREGAPPVLLLHGGGVAGWMWEPLARELGEDWRLLIPDLPGHGRSAGQPYESHAATLAALRGLLAGTTGGTKVTVIGFSLGAQLAILLAATQPARVSGAVIVSAQAKPLRFSGPLPGLLGLAAPLARRRWFAELQARELAIPAALLEEYVATSADISRDTLVAATRENLTFEVPRAWAQFPGRALVLAGERERRLMLDSAAAIAAALPGAEAEIVERCGHGIPLERPDWFARRVRAWLAAG